MFYTLQMQWTGDGIARLTAAANQLAGPQKNVALRRALNHTGRKVFTRTKRELARQINTTQAVLIRYGKLRFIAANNASLQAVIMASGGPIPLKHFKPRRGVTGVSVDPWRERDEYKSSFIIAKFGGHIFWRKSRRRLPIQRIAGPNVPKEMVKDQVAAAFHVVVNSDLPPRVAHEIRRLTKGALS